MTRFAAVVDAVEPIIRGGESGARRPDRGGGAVNDIEPEWVEAGARAFGGGDNVDRDIVAVIIAAVAPLIRADEREHHGNNCRGMWDEWVHDLRAQVEALPDVGNESDPRWSRVYRSSVLRLLGGESDE